jgi:hypothetical protein
MIIKDVSFIDFSMVVTPVNKRACINMKKENLFVITKNHQQYYTFCMTGIYSDRYYYIYISDGINLHGLIGETFIKYGEWWDKKDIDRIIDRLNFAGFKEIFYTENYKKDLT